MGDHRRYVFVSVTTEPGAMPVTALEAVQQYAYRLADTMNIKPITIRAEATDSKSITFTFVDHVTYEPAPPYAVDEG